MTEKLSDGEQVGLGVVGGMMYGCGTLFKVVPVVGTVAGAWTCHEAKRYLGAAATGEMEDAGPSNYDWHG
jgi:hypothetical protein